MYKRPLPAPRTGSTRAGAEYMSLDVGTLSLLRSRKTGASHTGVRKQIRYKRSDLDAYLASHRGSDDE